MRYLPLAMLLAMGSQAIAETTDCSRIEDNQARLACFDQQFPRTDGQASEISAQPAPPPSKQTRPAQTTDDVVPISAASGQSAAKQHGKPASRADGADDGFLGGMFDNKKDVKISARIAAVRKKDKQKMVFMLDNEQVWLQSTPRNLPIRVGETATIKSTMFGGYLLKTENGTSTRVQRIK